MAQDAPPPPPGFVVDDEPETADQAIITSLTGDVHDGDTFRLSSGENARLFGVDAFELRQQGVAADGRPLPIGERGRDRLVSLLDPQTVVNFTGEETWGRPVVTLDVHGSDPAQSLAREGWALAAPDYLRADPERFTSYMEAERLARLNRLGAHGTTFATPESFREGNGSPWAEAEWTNDPAEGRVAVFADEPTPFQGLRPEIEQGYIGIWQDPQSTPEDLIAFAQENGFSIDPETTRELYAQRDAGGEASSAVTYQTPPRLLTNPDDGRFGAYMRGFGDPVNLLDEAGGFVDALGGTGGRENIWNSDRRFGDILWNNIEQNRSILDYDDATYPYTRFGGQLTSGVMLPGGAVRGVGMAAARTALRGGASRLGAAQAAKSAVRNRLAAVGAIEGAVAGAGAGETTGERLTGAAIGAPAGGFLGAAAGELVPALANSARQWRQSARDLTDAPGMAPDPFGMGQPAYAGGSPRLADDGPPPPAGFQLDQPSAPMEADFATPTLEAPRIIDRLDLSTEQPRTLSEGERMAADAVPPAENLLAGDIPEASRAGNIDISRLDTPAEIDRALSIASDTAGGFMGSRRGVVSHEETQRLASDMGMTADQLLARRNGEAFNAEQALAARQILARSGEELVSLAGRVQAMENPGDELLAQFRQAWVRHAAIQEQVAGATAEAGRALSQFRMLASSRLASGPVLNGLVQEAGGADRLKDAARVILDSAEDPGLLNRTAVRALKPKFSDKLVELWYNSLLSGPQTHAVNVMSNTLTSLAQIPEHAAAAGVGAVRRMLPSQRHTDAILFSELGARAAGLLQGTREGLVQAARTMRTGEPSDFMSKVEARYPNAISGVKGSVIRTPTRALAAEDELFKAMARRMELGGLAVRQAAKEGLSGDAARARAAELAANPTDEMLDRAFKYGQYLTFQNELGPVGQGVSRITQTMPVLKLVLPFIRTPTNLLKFTIERSPAAPILKEWRADVQAGGPRRDLAVSRAMVGSGMMALVTEMVAQGHVTGGGPADENAKALMRADGWQPYSVRIGDSYYSYQRMDPFASTIGIAADLVDLQGHMTDKQREEVATLLVAATLKNLSNKTWLSGLTDLTEAINDPDRSAQRFLARLAGSIAVPAGVAQVARTTDPVLRDAQSELDRIRSRIPGLSDALEPRRDVWGQPIVSEGGLGPDIISPVWESTRRNDPLTNALLGFGGRIGAPSRKVGGRELTPREYGEYREEIGERARPILGDIVGVNDPVASALFSSLSIDERRDLIADALTRVRREVRKDMFGGTASPGTRGAGGADPALAPPPPDGFVLD